MPVIQLNHAPAPSPAPRYKVIYEPSGKAGEYSPLALNLYNGCTHGCVYCYAPMVLKRDKFGFRSRVYPRPGILDLVRRDAQEYARVGDTRPVLLCFTCDPYWPGEDEEKLTRETLGIFKEHGVSFHVLTKGGLRAVRDLDLYKPGDQFAVTLTTLNRHDSYALEPGAAFPDDRIEALRQFHAAGVRTWVSLEPVLYPEGTLALIRATADIVDLYKVGRLNYSPKANEIDWGSFGRSAVALLDELGKDYYVKEDLRKCMEADRGSK